MKSCFKVVGLSIVLAGYTASAGAVEPSAMVQQPKGQVFVGQAKTMTPARHAMPLYLGNRVIVATGKTTVRYPDGCTVSMSENSLLSISGPNQCKAGQAVVRVVDSFKDPRIGQAGPTGIGTGVSGLTIAGVTFGAIVLTAGIASSGDSSSTQVEISPQ